MVDELPLIELFTQLREAGLPLGIDEYKLLLAALEKGFGVSDRSSLYRLCKTLWVKSSEDRRLLDYHFELLVKEPQQITPIVPEKPTDSPLKQDDKEVETISKESTDEVTVTAPPSELTIAMEDEMQAAKAVIQTTSIDEKIPYNKFILTSDYFPVTRRQMKQTWRYLRRPIREGSIVELDIEATVNQIGRDGVLLEPVLVPCRINRAELLLLIDQDGSMVPFHALSQRLAETAVRGGRLGNAGIYYFHNCPVEYVYHDPYHLEAEEISDLLVNLRGDRSVMLIFSDAGAARGGYSEERIELTEGFLKQIKTKVRYITWLNPMPKSRWDGTAAGRIAQILPMFELTRRGLQDAITCLRGR